MRLLNSQCFKWNCIVVGLVRPIFFSLWTNGSNLVLPHPLNDGGHGGSCYSFGGLWGSFSGAFSAGFGWIGGFDSWIFLRRSDGSFCTLPNN